MKNSEHKCKDIFWNTKIFPYKSHKFNCFLTYLFFQNFLNNLIRNIVPLNVSSTAIAIHTPVSP